ncbi:MAG TPA: hypothetical protein VGO52_24175 [Hyphomonadaceae bacterium]|jgi:hypothetical protein|nr:hypothetical protein [Hyphomonadaceae bacterium]
MSPFFKLSAGLVTSILLGSTLFTLEAAVFPAEAKEFNKPKGIPADSQALVNRIQAEMSATNTDGAYGSQESNCDELNVGSNTEGSRPDDQVIVADKIVNVGGHCRMVRNNGGFKPTDQATPNGAAKVPAKKQ